MSHRYLLLFSLFIACRGPLGISIPSRPADAVTGTAFYKKIIPLSREAREQEALQEILSGNMPAFLKKFVPIKVSITDSSGKTIQAEYYVLPDYLAVGSNEDFARIPLTPMTAQKIADTFHCFLPTRKMVNDIYQQATVKLEPVPLYIHRDSALIFWHHHLIIEGQRKGAQRSHSRHKKRRGDQRKNFPRSQTQPRCHLWLAQARWQNPIQPLYTGHVDWYVDYSHGIRLAYRKIKVDGQWKDYEEVMKDVYLKWLLCDEEACDYYRY